nr:hypothetical protein [Sulfurovaceae bacterium]
MSKKVILLSGLCLLLILSGCAKKSPNPKSDPNLNHEFDGKVSSDNNNNITNGVVNPNNIASNTVTIDENEYDNTSSSINVSTDAFNSSSSG